MLTRYLVALVRATIGVLSQQIQEIKAPVSLIVCQPVMFSWSGGSSPYQLSIVLGNKNTKAPIRDFGEQIGTAYTWIVDLPAGTPLVLKLIDSTGRSSYSSSVIIQAGTSDSCLPRLLQGVDASSTTKGIITSTRRPACNRKSAAGTPKSRSQVVPKINAAI